jgi:acetyl esterase/lipase
MLSLLNILWTDHRILWMTSIVTTELGHLFALMTLAVAYLSYQKFKWQKHQVFLVVAFILFLLPLASNLMLVSKWETKFRSHLHSTNLHLFSFKSMLLGFEQLSTEPETYEYSKTHNLSLDYYRAKCSGPCPFVVVVHGGGWDSGDAKQLSHIHKIIAAGGFSVAAINYRLVPKAIWPSPKEDLISAINFLKSKSSELNLDPQQYIVMGRSAGSQIAGVFAYTYKDPNLKGYINIYGPTDLEFGYEIANDTDVIESKKLLENYLGGPLLDNVMSYQSASLLKFVSTESVPTLILHGKNDPLCWYKHAERLSRRLKYYKVPVVDMVFPYATHGMDYFSRGSNGAIATQAILHFLSLNFKEKK